MVVLRLILLLISFYFCYDILLSSSETATVAKIVYLAVIAPTALFTLAEIGYGTVNKNDHALSRFTILFFTAILSLNALLSTSFLFRMEKPFFGGAYPYSIYMPLLILFSLNIFTLLLLLMHRTNVPFRIPLITNSCSLLFLWLVIFLLFHSNQYRLEVSIPPILFCGIAIFNIVVLLKSKTGSGCGNDKLFHEQRL
jgi:hypothetical protein